jgi:hypothetical protein
VAGSSRWASLEEVIADRSRGPLEVLREVAKYQRYLAAIERRAVQASRAEGRTWDEVGAASGVTRQASWKRWGRTFASLEPLDPETAATRHRVDPVAVVRRRRWVVLIGEFGDVEQVGTPYRTGDEVEIVIGADDAELRQRVVDFVAGLASGSGGRVEPLGDGRLRLIPPHGGRARDVG